MRSRIYLTAFAVLTFLFINNLSAQKIQESALKQIQSLIKEKESRTPAQKKINSQLLYAMKMEKGETITAEVSTLAVELEKNATGLVQVDISADVTPALLDQIKNLGGEIVYSSARFISITAKLPLGVLEQLAASDAVRYIQPWLPAVHNSWRTNGLDNYKKNYVVDYKKEPVNYLNKDFSNKKINRKRDFITREDVVRKKINAFLNQDQTDRKTDFIGSVTSEADVTHKAALARTTFGINGAGVKIGVLSDGVDGMATSQASGDLPAVVTILPGQAGTGSEGRAMLELIYDLAPGAQLYYATAFTSQASFAQNILDLRAAGCDIIVDDVSYLREAVFQDDNVAQAVNTVTASGALYFSSAGNSGNKNDNTSGAWEGDFLNAGTGTVGTVVLPGGTVHDFGGGTLSNLINLTALPFLKWSDPLLTSANDYDLFILDNAAGAVVASSTNVQDGIGGNDNPLEFVGSQAVGRRIVIFKKTAAAVRALHLNTNRGRISVNTSGVVFGHNAAGSGYSVAATPAIAPGPFPGVFSAANAVETFSSDGPRRIFYNPDGSPITPGNLLFGTAGGTLLQKPDITAADGTVTATPGFNPFYGTSAAAPHAAAIAALIKSKLPALTPAQIKAALFSSAIDIEAPGTDRDAGAGIIMAYEALLAAGAVPNSSDISVGLVTAIEGTYSNTNSIIEPGELASMTVQLNNTSAPTATSVTAVLTTSTPGVTITQGIAGYGNITGAGNATNTGTPYLFGINSSVPCGTIINFTLTVTYGGGGASPKPLNFTVTTGALTVSISETMGVAPAPSPDYTAVSGLQTGRLNRLLPPSSCAIPKVNPGLFSAVGSRQFHAYTFTNSTSINQCVAVTMNSAGGINIFTAVYNNSGFVPATPNTNYLADQGNSLTANSFSFTAPAGQSFTVVVHDVALFAPTRTATFGPEGTDYTLTVSLPYCDAPPACTTVVVSPVSIPVGTSGTPYSQVFSATGGSGAYTFALTGALPTGLSFSGNTLSGTPTASGTFPITVTVSDITGCPQGTQNYSLVINPGCLITRASAVGTDAQIKCVNEPLTSITYTTVGATGAIFSGLPPGVNGNFASNVVTISGTPNTSVGSPFNYTVTLTGGGCGAFSATGTITVNPLPTLFTITGGGAYCNNSGAIPNAIGLSGSTIGVNYQLFRGATLVGAPVPGTGGPISFGQQGVVGTYTVVATNATTGCTQPMTGSKSVLTISCDPVITDPCTCLNNATTLTNGQFGETVTVNGTAGQTWTVTAVTGLYTTASPAPPLAPIPILVGATMTEGPAGVYNLTGKHIDALGYTITVNNGLGTSLSIGNNCEYPNPVINGIAPVLSTNAAPITLTGTPGDANIVSQSFTINGVPATQFTPSVPGAYTIGYTVNGGVPKAFGANDPGCTQTVTQSVTVLGSVNGTIQNAGLTEICNGNGSVINVNLTGVPNFAGNLSIAVLGGIGTPTPNVAFGPAPFNGATAFILPAGVSVSGASAIAIPANLLPNTSSGITVYRITWLSTTSLRDGSGNSPTAGAPLTGSQDVTVYPNPSVLPTHTTTVDAMGDVCPGTNIIFTVTNPNLIPGSTYNWTAVGADLVALGSANNVAFGTNQINNNFGITCSNSAVKSPITFTFTPVGPTPLGCVGTPVVVLVHVRDRIAPVNTNGNGSASFLCADAAGIGVDGVSGARAFVPTFSNNNPPFAANCSGAPVLTTTGEVYAPTCGYSAPYVAGQTGTLTQSWTATEPCGQATTVTQVITITDNTAPTWTTAVGSLNTTIECKNDPIAQAAQLAAAQAFVPVASDNGCSTSAQINSAPFRVKTSGVFAQSAPGLCVTAGTYTNTFITRDACGNSSTVFTQIITIVDNTRPTLGNPGPQTLDVGAGCTAPLPNYVPMVSYSDCTPVNAALTVQSPVAGTPVLGVGGVQVVQVSMTDGCGNSSTVFFNVTLVDITPPVARCHDTTLVLSALGTISMAPSVIDGNGFGPSFNPKSSDNCGLHPFISGLAFNPANTGLVLPFPAANGNTNINRNFTCANLGVNVIQLAVTDASSNTSFCNSNVTIVDRTAPVITCVAPSTLQKNATCVTILPSFIGVGQTTATDACPGVTITQSPAAGTIIAAGVTSVPVVFIATDGSGNTATCTTTIQFRDQAAPVLVNCPASFTVTTGIGNTNCQVFVNWTPPTATDNCSPILGTTSLTSTHTSGQQFFVGITTVTYTATDVTGNSTTCSFNVTVVDNTLPTITCLNTTNRIVNPNTASCIYTHGNALWDATGTDNCIPIPTMFYTLTGATVATGTNGQSLIGRSFNAGVTTITWRAVDQSTNSTTCSFTVTVVDTQAPTITCPAPVAVNTNAAGCKASVAGALTTPVTADNCGVTLLEWSVSGATPISSGIGNLGTYTFNVGTSLVTYRVSDASGNSTICSFNVVVTNAASGSVSGTATVAQNINTTSTITFTGLNGVAPYTFTYTINGGAIQTITTPGVSNITTVPQSNAVIGVFVYNLLTVTDANGCVQTPAPVGQSATITIATGAPDLSSGQFFNTTQILPGGVIEEVVSIRNLGTLATSAQVEFTITNYSALTGLTVSMNPNPAVTLGFTTFTLDNANWSFNALTGTFTSNPGLIINTGALNAKNIGVRITRSAAPNQGANGQVNHTITITNGTGGGDTSPLNNSISNTLLKN